MRIQNTHVLDWNSNPGPFDIEVTALPSQKASKIKLDLKYASNPSINNILLRLD